jgi:hypothetical protein
MRRGGGHISHEAHLAGAISGLLLAGFLAPEDSVRFFTEFRISSPERTLFQPALENQQIVSTEAGLATR